MQLGKEWRYFPLQDISWEISLHWLFRENWIRCRLVHRRNFRGLFFEDGNYHRIESEGRKKKKILKLKIKNDILYANELEKRRKKKHSFTWALFGDGINYQHNFAVIFMQILVAFWKAETFLRDFSGINLLYVKRSTQTLVWFSTRYQFLSRFGK